MLTSEQIRSARLRAGYSQGMLAQLIGVTGRTVGNWERGETSPASYAPKLRAILSPYMDEGHEGSPSLAGASDVELLAEIARRFTRTAREQDHGQDHQQDQEPSIVTTIHRSDPGPEQKTAPRRIAAHRNRDPEIGPDDLPED